MITLFNSKTTPELRQVGGKAKALIETTQAGFPVPEGMVLSVAYFEEWLSDIKASSEWSNFLTESTKANCDKLFVKAENMAITEKQQIQLTKHLAHLPGQIFSVRSSSPEEDMEGTSFAGMYETYLGITKDKLEKHIAKAFASCFDYRVMEYKRLNNISFDHTAIAIIIQRQIQSEISGVAFSLNPLNNAYDEVVINASFGLGEAIVSGLVTPDIYIVDKVLNKIIEKKVAKKELGIWLLDTGGTKEKNNANPTEQALSDTQILSLEQLVSRIEKHYGKPMDIEWAIEDEKWYLLQARPITTHIPLFPEMLTKSGDTKDLYMDFILATQGFSEPMSNLGLDIWAKMVYMGNGLPRGKDGILWSIHGRHYIIMSHVMKVSAALTKTFSSHDAPTKEIFAHLNKHDFIQKSTPKKLKWFLWETTKFMFSLYGSSTFKGLLNSKSTLLNYKKTSDEVWKYFHEELEQSNKPFETLVNEALSGFKRLVKEIGGLLVAANLAKWKIERMFKKHNEASDLIVSLAMNLPDNPVSEMGRLMLKTASFPEFVNTNNLEDFENKLNAHKYSDEFLSSYNEYIKRFGCRGVKEIDIATPRISEDISQIFSYLKEIDINNNATLNVKKRSEEAYNRLCEIARSFGKEQKFIRLANTYRDMIGFRDHPKYMYVVAISLLRKKALKLGEEFTLNKRLQTPEQIFNLSISEISLAEKDPYLDLLSLVEKNIAPYNAVKNVKDWPRLIDSRGKIYHAIRNSKDGEIPGEPISPGVIKGKAKILMNPQEKPLHKGEILVCRASEPSWAPVFINAAGIVMEVGGPLQHGAIIAREYGLPCVSSVYNATKIINDGDIIEVDGSNGIVKVLESRRNT
ncbi:PEP/pyruvate-binding domain-containing protein [Aureibacter tunicatorum]|uniref:Pyruvate,water dikinase n=1 Tax=Aureibacter tunicatorum TaxID=866807 RepID=A0AAE4BTF1_9BACT|nr:PEP/pyruvate-binding domain-containing protein [Aureibacter tunicatorum]MDR6239517.1 pyruvate,water dikinase [Aureibacter tunicatorum]